ncbi:DNA repair protein RAD51-like protein 4 [Nibea albiflora]|uniref:DNA repair protein RAD51-like protein 4 n=1 Tax=Nibea albiflora TaxID=240163 RepID=A0ACB7F2Y7_NIBAL|nr:DNA repair protein RAD51-like protein 4 [Nibea albiflora]
MAVLSEGMCPGLDEVLLRGLRAADVKTVEDLVSSDIEELARKCSVSYKALFAIRRVLLAQHTAFPVSGADLYEELLSSTAIISTGNPCLDKVLDSGLYTGEITELSGGPGSGKSQASVGGGSVKAVIVDSVSAVIAPLLGGKQNEGMSLMIQVAGALKTMAKDFNVAALVTNHVTRSGSGEVQPGLGVSWSHIPRTRLLLEQVEKGVLVSLSSLRTATLIKSSRQPCHIKEVFDLQWWSRSKEGSSGKRKLDETDS